MWKSEGIAKLTMHGMHANLPTKVHPLHFAGSARSIAIIIVVSYHNK